MFDFIWGWVLPAPRLTGGFPHNTRVPATAALACQHPSSKQKPAHLPPLRHLGQPSWAARRQHSTGPAGNVGLQVPFHSEEAKLKHLMGPGQSPTGWEAFPWPHSQLPCPQAEEDHRNGHRGASGGAPPLAGSTPAGPHTWASPPRMPRVSV